MTSLKNKVKESTKNAVLKNLEQPKFQPLLKSNKKEIEASIEEFTDMVGTITQEVIKDLVLIRTTGQDGTINIDGLMPNDIVLVTTLTKPFGALNDDKIIPPESAKTSAFSHVEILEGRIQIFTDKTGNGSYNVGLSEEDPDKIEKSYDMSHYLFAKIQLLVLPTSE